MTAKELRAKFLNYFKSQGHAILPSASLIPENDPTVLFTTAGMHPLVPYLLGAKHPSGTRLTNSQKCIRTQDIEDVGDKRHITFFEMLGIWSLGDYFKKDVIPWTFEFFTKELGFDPKRLYTSVFMGNDDAPRDDESVKIWQAEFERVGIKATLAPAENPDINSGHRIFQYPKAKNWWGPAGQTGPCGPDTEIFYDTGKAHDLKFGAHCHPNCDCGRFIEIGNDVFMEFNKNAEGKFEPLAAKNVDVGWGLERLTAMTQGKNSVFETELFAPVIAFLESASGKRYGTDELASKSMEIIADHIRAATFILADPRGIVPSNVEQGYVLRRFIRRAVRHARLLGIQDAFIGQVSEKFIEIMSDVFTELSVRRTHILDELKKEEDKFGRTIAKGLKEFEKMWSSKQTVSGEDAFFLYQSYGFPLELTRELVAEKGKVVDVEVFNAEFAKHQELSRKGAEHKFAGGLADHSVEVTRLHTATHLLHKALRQVLGEHVEQRGSNITKERLRFDFSHGEKVTPEQLAQVEKIVNEQIKRDLPVSFKEMTVSEAKQEGAIGLFEEKYGEKVKVYQMGDFSKEICGGPHVEHTGELKNFKILKEEAVSAGIRRIKANVSL